MIDAVSNDFIELCAVWDLHQIVNESTQGKKWLDLILTSYSDLYADVIFYLPLFQSIHDAVVPSICEPDAIEDNQSHYVLDFKKANYAAIAQCLLSFDWPATFSSCRLVNDYWSTFYES